MLSFSEENYLKTIYHIEQFQPDGVSTNAIAKKIQTKASSVTDMLKKLAAKQLIIYEKYQGVQLTKEGKKIALKVIRRHRLWEYFLVKKLNYRWDEVHEIAEQLEHIKSKTLIDNLEEFLRFPKFDPHGDPIPDKNGKMILTKTISLLELKVGQKGVLDSLKDSSDAFLKYLNKKNLALRDRIKVIDIEPYDNSVHIETKTHQLLISKKVAENLNIKV
ncbi:MAG: metal-dependent transcriptional regulator [Flavobacteriaceae bacterium]|nr:metal-dependent transcriptional regulator [Flavobacteriaceae bacterium]